VQLREKTTLGPITREATDKPITRRIRAVKNRKVFFILHIL